MDNYLVVYQNLPYKVNAFTMYNACDNFYTIVINSRISHSSAKRAFLHEIEHINRGDFHSNKDVNEIELIAHSC